MNRGAAIAIAAAPEIQAPACAKQTASRTLRVLFAAGFRGDRKTGAGNAVISLAEALHRRGHTVEMLFVEDVPAAKRHGRALRLTFPWVVMRNISRRAAEFDVVVIHEPSAMAYVLSRQWNSSLPPCIVMSHGVEQRCWDLNAEKTTRSFKTRMLHPATELAQANYSLRHADAVVCLSSDDADYIERRLGVPASRIHRLTNGVDAEKFGKEWTPCAEPGLLFAGSWIPRKGKREFVQAFSELRRSHPKLRVTIVGSGLPADVVRADFAAADREAVDVRPNVSREELPALLARDQVFVLPSYFEGMPLTLLEAMAAGLPCVTTNICGMRDLITDGRDGFLIPPGDPSALARHIEALVGSDALRRRIGGAARATALRNTWEAAAIHWEPVLEKAVDARPRRFILQDGRWSDEISEDPGDRLTGVLLKLSEEVKRSPDGFREMEQWSDLGIAGRILDLGCGTGWKTAYLQRERSNSVVALDRDPRLLEFGRNTFGVKRLVEGDACGLAFPASSFDWVLAVEVVEHLPRPDLFLREVHRVLRPGGKLLLTTPNRLQYLRPWHPRWCYRALRGRLVLEPSHVREFSAREFEGLLPAGLQIERLSYRGMLCGRPFPIAIKSVPQPFRGWWAQGIEVVARKADA